MPKLTDTELLDQLAARGNGDQWIVRESEYGRGFRLHNVSDYVVLFSKLTAFPTPREALQAMTEQETPSP